MTSQDIDRLFQKLVYGFIGAIVGGAFQSAIPSIYPFLMMVFMVLLLVLVLVYVNRREKELAQPNKPVGADGPSSGSTRD